MREREFAATAGSLRPARECQLGRCKGKWPGGCMRSRSAVELRLMMDFAQEGLSHCRPGRGCVTSHVQEVPVSQLTISAILGGVGKSCLTGKVRRP